MDKKNSKSLLVISLALGIVAAVVALAALGMRAAAFVGPTGPGGVGSGAISVNASGSVGIGTASPGAKLHVVTDPNTLGITLNGNGATLFNAIGGTGVGTGIGWRAYAIGNNFTLPATNIPTVAASGYGHASAIGFGAEDTTDTGITFWTGSGLGSSMTEKMRIQNNGNVGIGTASPDANYELTTSGGGVKAENSSASQPAGYFANAGGGPAVLVGPGGLTLGGVNQTAWPSGGLTGAGTVNYIGKFTGAGAIGNSQLFDNGTNVGIGTAAPGQKLEVAGNVSSTRVCLSGVCNTAWPAGNSGTVTSITAGAGLSGGVITGAGTISLNLGNANTWTAAQTFNGGLTATTLSGAGTGLTGTASGLNVNYATTAGNITAYTINQNLGTANSPTFQEVYGNGWFRSNTGGTGWYSTAYGVGVYATQAGRVDLYNGAGLYVPGAITTGGGISVGGGTGKITAGTMDPPYMINGEKFATYVPGMTGQKEETTGVAQLARAANSEWQKTIDFNALEKGSDLWLFAQATALKDHFADMTVLLTSSFNGRVWYEKDSTNHALILHAIPSDSQSSASNLEISYRLTAPRFDSAKLPNTRTDSAPGLIINN